MNTGKGPERGELNRGGKARKKPRGRRAPKTGEVHLIPGGRVTGIRKKGKKGGRKERESPTNRNYRHPGREATKGCRNVGEAGQVTVRKGGVKN